VVEDGTQPAGDLGLGALVLIYLTLPWFLNGNCPKHPHAPALNHFSSLAAPPFFFFPRANSLALQLHRNSHSLNPSARFFAKPVSFIPLTMDTENHKIVAESSSVEGNDQFEMGHISQLGGTNNDEHDMRMLGRTQVLNVRTLHELGVSEHTTNKHAA
jgi:hypothetical protein